MTRAHIHTSALSAARFRRTRRSILGQLAPIFGIMFTKSQKKKKVNLNLEVAKPDTVNYSQSALFSRETMSKKRGRAARDGRDCGIGKKRRSQTNPPSHVCGPRRRFGRKKKLNRATDNVLATRGLLPCVSHAHTNNFRKAVLFACCRRHEREPGKCTVGSLPLHDSLAQTRLFYRNVR